jgi:ribosome biogenesis GTPase
MAKRKGKSQHRINWGQRFTSGEAQDEFAPRQKLSRRGVKIPANRIVTEQENVEDLPKREGMILGLFPGGTIVRAEDGEKLICSIAKMFRAAEGSTALAVGDNVTVALTRPEHVSGQTQEDKDRTDGMILQRQPRKSVVSRPQPRSGKRGDRYTTEAYEKVIVANMDVLLVVASTVQPPLRHGLIDRFMIIAERGHIQPLLVINKIDLAEPDPDVVRDFGNLGMEIFEISATTGTGVEALRQRMSSCRSVLAGPSGVGKSTLVNALVPGALAVTGAVRLKDLRGRHTTASANVYDLPCGGMLVDTPGVRELGVRLSAAELPWYFPEFEPFSSLCKFRDCTHTHEPQCAVIEAAEQNKILPRRYESYLRILETIEES